MKKKVVVQLPPVAKEAPVTTRYALELEALEPGARKLRIAEIRKRYIGHMFFIGALYKHEMLKESIMHHCVQELFGDPDEPDGEKIECLAKLMATIGKQLDAAALEKLGRLYRINFEQYDSPDVAAHGPDVSLTADERAEVAYLVASEK